MEQPIFFDNINSRVIDDLRQRLKSSSRIAIAAASFSIYAFEALKDELSKVEDLHFIFTSPTFTTERGILYAGKGGLSPSSQKPYLDRQAEIITHGEKLPHWDQEGKYQFITFRLADSLPQCLLSEYKINKENWKRFHPQSWDERQNVNI